MSDPICFRPPRLLLPQPGIDLSRWAVIACDQHTSEPEYWQRVEQAVGDAPSTLNLIFPEVHLGKPDAPDRIRRIQQTMRDYLARDLLREHAGPVYVERTIGGRVRRGLMLELDLEHYDFSRTSTSLIRPTEGTMIERLAPRIAVRRDAELEVPHVLMLIDDPDGTVIEPIGAERDRLQRLYETELMLGGGRVAGYAVDDARFARAARALQAMMDPTAFERHYAVPAGTPTMLFASGDGNHSLATAKAYWDSIRASVGMAHPSRYALVEVENIHDAALAFEPIHRLLFGVTIDLRQALAQAFGDRATWVDVATPAAMRARVQAARGPRHAVGVIGPGARFGVVEIDEPASTLAVGVLQQFVDRLIEQGGAASVDYVHGDDSLERLAQADGNIGLHLAPIGKHDLLRMVVREGPTPRKTFSMGEAHEKRYYIEARRIR